MHFADAVAWVEYFRGTHKWRRAAELGYDIRRTVQGFGLEDALLLAAAERSGSMVPTGDPHFRKMGNVVFLGQRTGGYR